MGGGGDDACWVLEGVRLTEARGGVRDYYEPSMPQFEKRVISDLLSCIVPVSKLVVFSSASCGHRNLAKWIFRVPPWEPS